MKKVIGVIFCGFILVTMSGGLGWGQDFHNELGLYADPSGDPAATSIDVAPYTLFNLYLVLKNPYNYSVQGGMDAPETERPISLVSGVYCQILFPDSVYNTGTFVDCDDWVRPSSAPEFSFGFFPGIPVADDGTVVLATLEFMVTDADPKELFLSPSGIAPYDEDMWVLDASNDPTDYWFASEVIYPSSGDYDAPVFGINTSVVATQDATWDGVKALYR